MNYKVIHIFGASGSGVSTLGKKLKSYGYTQIDVDDYYWLPTNPPFTTKRPIPDRIKMINDDILKFGKVVITGSLCGWGDPLIPSFDLAIRTKLDHDTRMERIKERETKRYGDRILPNGDMHKSSCEFINWASNYDTGDTSTRSKTLHDEWQQILKCPLITVETLDSEKAINEITTYIGV